MVITPACHAGGRGFEPRRPRHFFGRIAQLGERQPYKLDVGGSIPSSPTKIKQWKRRVRLISLTLCLFPNIAVQPFVQPLDPINVKKDLSCALVLFMSVSPTLVFSFSSSDNLSSPGILFRQRILPGSWARDRKYYRYSVALKDKNGRGNEVHVLFWYVKCATSAFPVDIRREKV